jgi:transposase
MPNMALESCVPLLFEYLTYVLVTVLKGGRIGFETHSGDGCWIHKEGKEYGPIEKRKK